MESFAKEWGFIVTRSFDLQSVKQVKEFTDSCSLTGSWNGEPLEGFVVRTRVRGLQQATETTGGESDQSGQTKHEIPPYPPGSSFFFKVKFDEPYMMYRDWREITKSYLSAFTKVGILLLL